MGDNRIIYSNIVLLCLAFGALVAAWFFIGPGGALASDHLLKLDAALKRLAQWYQTTLDGSAKLFAPLVTIASGTFAIVQAYRYAQRRLHHRLRDYLAREECRLREARQQLRLIVERPAVPRTFRAPVFLSGPLKDAVRELGWGSYFLPPQMDYAEFQISAAIVDLDHQVGLANQQKRHLDTQLATAHLLRGSMFVADASAAKKSGKDDRVYLTDALNHFRSALAVDPNDCEALEYASHVHVCLKQDREAEELLDKLLSLTAAQQVSLTRARALRYKANIAALRGRHGVAARNLKKSLAVLPNLCGTDRIEEAEIQELLADSQRAIGANVQAHSHWEIATALYSQIPTADGNAGVERVDAKLAQLDKSPDRDRDNDDGPAERP